MNLIYRLRPTKIDELTNTIEISKNQSTNAALTASIFMITFTLTGAVRKKDAFGLQALRDV